MVENNVRSISNYIKGKNIVDKEILTTKDKIFYEVMLNLRTNRGIDKEIFKDEYNVNISDVVDYKDLVKMGVLKEDDKYLRVSEEYFYVLDEILCKIMVK